MAQPASHTYPEQQLVVHDKVSTGLSHVETVSRSRPCMATYGLAASQAALQHRYSSMLCSKSSLCDCPNKLPCAVGWLTVDRAHLVSLTQQCL